MKQLDFGQAFAALKQDRKIVRAAWSAPRPEGSSEPPKFNNWLERDKAGSRDIVVMVTEGAKNTYNPSSADIFAEDWLVVED